MKTYRCKDYHYTWDPRNGDAVMTHTINGTVVGVYRGRCRIEPVSHSDWNSMGNSWVLDIEYTGQRGRMLLERATAAI
jgi:hypothetical protein